MQIKTASVKCVQWCILNKVLVPDAMNTNFHCNIMSETVFVYELGTYKYHIRVTILIPSWAQQTKSRCLHYFYQSKSFPAVFIHENGLRNTPPTHPVQCTGPASIPSSFHLIPIHSFSQTFSTHTLHISELFHNRMFHGITHLLSHKNSSSNFLISPSIHPSH